MRTCLGLLGVVCCSVAALPAIAAEVANVPVVKVTDLGQGPKKELRYRFQKDAAETLNLEMEMSMKMMVGGQKGPDMDMPIMKMGMKVKTLEIQENGDARIGMEFTNADVAAKADIPPAVAAEMRKALQKMVGMKGTGIISTRGESREAKFEPPPNADAQVLQAMKGAEQQLAQMAAPLPKEAVGIGAKWEVMTEVEANGVKLSQTILYTLKEIGDNTATFDVTIKQSAPRQMVQGMQLEKMQSTGSGTTKLDLSRIVPVDYGAKLDMIMVMSQGDQKIDMNMKMNVTMKPGQP
jgi:hypothetical protein